MNCPNCKTPYEGDLKFCPTCGHPLGNADYTPLSDKIEKKRQRKIALPLIILIICIILAGSAGIAYYVYINTVKTRCQEAVHQIFKMAHDMDFSSVPPEDLPDELKENPNIRSLIKEYISGALEKDYGSQLSQYITEVVDIDTICDDIVSNADYEILSTEADYHSCRITVKTSNTDYSKLIDALKKETGDRISDTDSSFWDHITSFFNSIISGEKSPEAEPDLKDEIQDIYETAKAETDKVTETGVIEFGIKDGSWTLTNIDTDLFYAYYGIVSFMK
jgi:rRNA maturation endonuclease Nob1